MTYGIIMKTLARFEFALGRRIGWSFGGHQIQVAPHAFADANAFYSLYTQGLHFGYFPSADGKRRVYSCLSHEIVAHEITHALLDGLRERYMDPSSPQQAGFHEASPMSSPGSPFSRPNPWSPKWWISACRGMKEILSRRGAVTPERLRRSALFGLAQEMGAELAGIHGQALRPVHRA